MQDAPSLSGEQIISHLQNLRHQDSLIRQQTQSLIEQLERDPRFPSLLIQIVKNDPNLINRQLSLLCLQSTINKLLNC